MRPVGAFPLKARAKKHTADRSWKPRTRRIRNWPRWGRGWLFAGSARSILYKLRLPYHPQRPLGRIFNKRHGWRKRRGGNVYICPDGKVRIKSWVLSRRRKSGSPFVSY